MQPAQFAVFGHPISHSLSPQIHRAFAQQFGIELDYRAIDAAPDDFAAAVQRFFGDGGRGANVTLPHKAAAFALANRHSEAATRVGSANVLTRVADGGLPAHNTDDDGLARGVGQKRHGFAGEGGIVPHHGLQGEIGNLDDGAAHGWEYKVNRSIF